MNYFEKYKAVNTPYGNTLADHTITASKESALRSFVSSPTLKQVEINDVEQNSIVSIYQRDYFDRTFLLEPNSQYADLGNYIKFNNYTYLVMKSNDDDIYPTLYGKLCNEDFKVPIKKIKKKIVDHRGNAKYIDEIEYITVPIVADVKGYSISDNAVLPLTEGRVIIYLQYKQEYVDKIQLNYEFELFNDAYKISDIQLENIVNNKGYITLSAQKVSEN